MSYETDYEKAKATILEMLSEDPRVVKGSAETGNADKAPFVGLKEMGDSSISLAVRAWANSSDYWPLFFEMNERFFTELPQKGFTFPFPQLDVHFDKPNV